MAKSTPEPDESATNYERIKTVVDRITLLHASIAGVRDGQIKCNDQLHSELVDAGLLGLASKLDLGFAEMAIPEMEAELKELKAEHKRLNSLLE